MSVKKSLKLGTIMSLMLTISVVQMFAATIGNATIARTWTDTYSDFTIIDTNNSVLADGKITSFSYYAANTNPFSFVVVDSANVVQYVSQLINPAATGVQTYTPEAPIDVTAGDNIGMYFQSTGTIPFDYVGDPAVWTPNNNGVPIVGNALTVEPNPNQPGRTYSLSATFRVPFDGYNRSYGYYKTHGPLPILAPTCSTQQVSSLNFASVFNVFPNTPYTITSSGTYTAGGNILADAKYSEVYGNGIWTDAFPLGGYPAEILDLQLSGNGTTFTSPNWGSFNPNHVYNIDYTTAAGQTQLFFKVADGNNYGDNSGSLTVTLCSGVTKFTTQEIRTAFDNYSSSAFNKFLTQYAVTLFNIQSNPALVNAVYDSGTNSLFDGMTVAQLIALAETYNSNTPGADLLALKDVFDNINNNRFIYLP